MTFACYRLMTIEMAEKLKNHRIFKKYFYVLNYRTFVAVLIAVLATWLSYKYSLIFNLDLTLISVAVVFPLVFTLGSAFQRREKALEHLGRAKGALAAIKYCFSFTDKIDESRRKEIFQKVNDVESQLIAHLYSESDDKTKLTQSVGEIQAFVTANRKELGRSLALRVYRLMRDVIMGIENSIAIKIHRTPQSVRAYCEIFIYIFPFFYAPTLIKNIEYQDALIGEIINSPAIPFMDNRFGIIVYLLNITISFILITLFNVQEQIEHPFDQEGIDDIKLENYEIDY